MSTDIIGMDQEKGREENVFFLFIFFFPLLFTSFVLPSPKSIIIHQLSPPTERSPEGECSGVFEEWSSLTSPQGLTPQSE